MWSISQTVIDNEISITLPGTKTQHVVPIVPQTNRARPLYQNLSSSPIILDLAMSCMKNIVIAKLWISISLIVCARNGIG